MEIELNRDFRDLLRSLNFKKVRYLLIGGYAVILHRHPRLTNDLDLVIGRDSANIELCVEVLREFGFTTATRELFAQPKSVVRMGVEPVKIEILNYLEGVNFDEAYERRETRTAQDVTFDIISLADLISNKKAVGRDKDLLDVKGLLEVHDLSMPS